jgi:phosphoribosylanthranilate isomerase
VKIKVCGLTTPADAIACVDAGVDWVGLNFHPGSPRFVDVERAATIWRALDGRAEAVGLFVDRPAGEVTATARAVGLDLVQLHGGEPPEYLAELSGVRVVKAFRLKDAESASAIGHYLDRAAALGHAPHAILVDAFVPGLAGGTGTSIADDLLGLIPAHPRLILAGGLTPENVADRAGRVGPWMVDVASGVESSPGRKCPGRIAAFVAALRTVAASPRIGLGSSEEPPTLPSPARGEGI